MKSFRRKSGIIICIITILSGFFGYVIWRPVYLFTETLKVGEAEDGEEGMYVIRITDEYEGDIAHIAFATHMLMLPSQNLTSIRISIWHKDGTHLDSLQVSFVLSMLHYPFHVYFETPPGGKWNLITSESTGERQVFSFPELGLYGSGTVTLNFLLGKWSDLPRITITTQIALHDTTSPITFTKQQATTTLTL